MTQSAVVEPIPLRWPVCWGSGVRSFIVKPNVRLPDAPGITWGDTVAVTARGGRRLGKGKHKLMIIEG